MSSKLQGKGMWIWQVGNCEGGDTAAIVAKAQRAGLTHLVVKIADGTSDYNGDVSGLVQAARQAGLLVWGWQYTYGSSPEEEAGHGANRAQQFAVDGFVIDAEVEYENNPSQAAPYVGALVPQLGGIPLALSSFYLPNYHAGFPWQEFLSVCTWNMPQVYWYTRDPVQALEASLQQNAAFGKPVFPTGAAYPGAATAPQVAQFLQAVHADGLPGVNFWDWQEATPEMWTAIRDYSWPRARLILGVAQPDGTFVYTEVPSEFRDDGQFWVRPVDLAPLLHLPSQDATWQPVRQVMAGLGVQAEFATQHLADPADPRVYAFAYAPGTSPLG